MVAVFFVGAFLVLVLVFEVDLATGIEYDKIDALRGMNISVTTTAKTDEEAKALLVAFKFSFRN